jgi:trans-2,3-dihydro-3-hydroxyanthranilate isomerase
MQRRYVTVDVFSDRVFGGNPLAVVLDAQGLHTAAMQAIAVEFNYSETTFVLPPRDPACAAHVRIFTPRTEVPFAGHPNVGTAVVIARELEAGGSPAPERMTFEELAGRVALRLLRGQGGVVGAEVAAPVALSIGAAVTADEAAACLSIDPREIVLSTHAPKVLSVGLPFLVAEVASRAVLGRAKPNALVHERVLPPIGTDSVFAYARQSDGTSLAARMFSPLDGVVEDPATGSAAAATIALLAALHAEREATIEWRIEQGVDMGRPSVIRGRTEKHDGNVAAVYIAGSAVPVMRGLLDAF